MKINKSCDYYFGSHGCDLPAGHPGHHQCGTPHGGYELCSEFNEADKLIRQWDEENEEWGDWIAYSAGGFYYGSS